jgi:hypothetical protein
MASIASCIPTLGREAFLAGDAFPKDAAVTMVAEASEGDVAFQLYEATRGARSIRVAEQLTIRDGQIASSVFVTDMAAFMTSSVAPRAVAAP